MRIESPTGRPGGSLPSRGQLRQQGDRARQRGPVQGGSERICWSNSRGFGECPDGETRRGWRRTRERNRRGMQRWAETYAIRQEGGGTNPGGPSRSRVETGRTTWDEQARSTLGSSPDGGPGKYTPSASRSGDRQRSSESDASSAAAGGTSVALGSAGGAPNSADSTGTCGDGDGTWLRLMPKHRMARKGAAPPGRRCYAAEFVGISTRSLRRLPWRKSLTAMALHRRACVMSGVLLPAVDERPIQSSRFSRLADGNSDSTGGSSESPG